MSRRAVLALVGVLLSVVRLDPCRASMEVSWQPVGIGGGGGIYYPSISPHDEKLVFAACDMGGVYRSEDGAQTWSMIDGREIRKLNAPIAFHPESRETLFAATRGGVKRSRDGGRTWEHLIGACHPAAPDAALAIAVDPLRPEVIWAHFDGFLAEERRALVKSENGGVSWRLHPGWPYRNRAVRKIVFDPSPSSGPRRVFVLAQDGLYRSDDDGSTWKAISRSLPGRPRDVAVAWDERNRRQTLLITLPTVRTDGRSQGGVYSSEDAGESWDPANRGLELRPAGEGLPQYELLAMSPGNGDRAFVSCSLPRGGKSGSNLWRTENGGRSWEPALSGRDRWKPANLAPDWIALSLRPGWGGSVLGLGCNPKDPRQVMFSDSGRAYRSEDGGRSWFPVHTRRVAHPQSDLWRSRGLEVSTAYAYLVDPHDSSRRYVTCTDFGLIRSPDGGESWAWAGRGSPWSNTCYALAFDPARPGLLFGAWAGAHDLPHWKMLKRGAEDLSRLGGGIAMSTDHAESWSATGSTDLPQAPATAVVLDPASPKDSRTLYAGFLPGGVYKSVDGGKHWAAKNSGLGADDNLNVWRLGLHEDGTLLCAKTLAYHAGVPVGGGIFRSRDGAESWERLDVSVSLDFVFDIQMDPRDSDTVYVACFDVPPAGFEAYGTSVPWPESRGGGVFQSKDGGKSWRRLLNEPWSWGVTLDPKHPGTLYAGTFHGGVYRSVDAGATWHSIRGLPFVCTQRVTVEPLDRRVLYVTTFGGGVWKGVMPPAPACERNP
ncbi:MAG: hypothetical protein AB1640_14195 [bacterium]